MNRCSAASCINRCPLATAIFDSLAAGHYTIGSRHHWASMTASRLGGREWRDRRRGRPTHPDWLRVLRDQCVAADILLLQAMGPVGSGIGRETRSSSGSRQQARCGAPSRSSQLGRHARSGKHQMRKSCAIRIDTLIEPWRPLVMPQFGCTLRVQGLLARARVHASLSETRTRSKSYTVRYLGWPSIATNRREPRHPCTAR